MDRETAQVLAPVVKHPPSLSAIKEYAQDRIEIHRMMMENCSSDNLKIHQGAIAELRRMFSLYEQVEQALKTN